MSLITLQEYKELCKITDDSNDLILQKMLDASIAQVISGIGENPCCNDSEGNPIKKTHKVKKYYYDEEQCEYCFSLPIPVKEVLNVNLCKVRSSVCGTMVTVKGGPCLPNCFDELEVEYYGGRNDTSDLCMLIKMMIEATTGGPSKGGSTVKSAKYGCETITFCCPDTNMYDAFVSNIQCKYFSNDVTCVF